MAGIRVGRTIDVRWTGETLLQKLFRTALRLARRMIVPARSLIRIAR